MAISGTIYGTCKNSDGATTTKYSTWIYWKRNSVDSVNNKSNITVYVRVKRTDGYNASAYNKSSKPSVSLKIGGVAKTPTITYIDTRNDVTCTFATWTGNVTHDDDGSLDLALVCSWSMSGASSLKSGSISGKATLDTIPRKSTLTVANGTLGTAQTLTVTRKSSNFTHTITYKCGSASGTICEKSSSESFSFTPPLSLAAQNTTGTSVSIEYTITTYNGSTSIGSNSYTKTCSIPASVKPSVSFSVEEATDLEWGVFVQTQSKLKIVVSAVISYGSAIASYKTTVDGKTYTASSFTTDVLAGAGTLTITTTVTDKRGRTATASKTITVLPYALPVVNSLNVKRCNEDGSENQLGEYGQVSFECTCSDLDGNNEASFSVQIKKTSEDEYSEVAKIAYGTIEGSTGTLSRVFAADSGSAYNVRVVATDVFNTAIKQTVLSTGFSILHILASGLGIAIGKIAEFTNTFDVAWKALFRKNVCIGEKTDLLDGKQGVFLDPEGFVHLQRTSAHGDHPHIAFLLDAETNISGLIRLNSADKFMEFLNASGYLFGNDMIFKNNNTAIYGHDADGVMIEAFNPQNADGDTVIGRGNYLDANGDTIISGNDVLIGSAAGGRTTYRPYYRAGDSVNVNINTAGFVSASKARIYFAIPLGKPVIGATTVTVTSISGIIIRQEGVYTHGSAADSWVLPSSYLSAAVHAAHVNITASMSSTTNAINNVPCGIQWHGTITFS